MMKNKKFLSLVILISSILCILSIFYFAFWNRMAYNINYHIFPNTFEENLLQVSLKITDLHFSEGECLEFDTGDVQISDISCKDNKGRTVSLQKDADIIRIPASDRRTLELSYKAQLGSVGKHGQRGGVYEDLIVFDGGSALLFPVQAISPIQSISITCDVPEGWLKAGPFEKIAKPGPDEFRILADTCFALGKFEKKEYTKGKSSFVVYTDQQNKYLFSAEAEEGLNALYDYYSSLFGYEVPRLSVLLLRNSPRDDVYIMGGASAKSIGATFNPDNPRDWELMGHRFFHAFFETEVKAEEFHQPPQLWFYEGLATYYEKMSMGSLPDKLKTRLALEPKDLFSMLFKKYVYMKIKDDALLSFAPMNERKIIQSPGRTEFLHYTQAPLAVKAMEDISRTQTGKQDAIIKYILENRSREDLLTLRNIVSYALKNKSEEFTLRYLLSDEILPLWYLGEGEEEKRAGVIKGLNDIEYELWSWFRLECQGYPIDELSVERVSRISNIKEINEIHFVEEGIENKIKSLSPTVYYLLKEYAVRAKICGEDFEDPLLRIKLLSDGSKLNQWNGWILEGNN